MRKESREHDKMYLQEDRKREPKEYFKFLLNHAREHLSQSSAPRILDIGCATGDLLYYIRSLHPEAALTGMDVMPALLDRARAEVPDCRFVQGSICERRDLPGEKFDAVFMCGVHSIFDSVRPWLENLVSLIEAGGRGYVFGIFNPEDVDVLVKVRPSQAAEDVPWESGWNCFSRKSVAGVLDALGVTSYRFLDWNIGIDIPRHEQDPLRSWTFRLEDGTRGVVNGTMILHHFMLLEIVP